MGSTRIVTEKYAQEESERLIMKKVYSKMLALVMVLIMVLGMNTTAFAAGEKGTITINNTVAGKQLEAYQLFSTTVSGTNVAYTLNPVYEGFFQNAVAGATGKTGEELSQLAYEYVQAFAEDSTRIAFAKNMLAWIQANNITPTKTTTTTATTTTITDLDYGFYLV